MALRRVEEGVATLYAHIPETLRLKETELNAEERRLANFVDFIGEGRGSRTLAQALLETERKVETLKEELEGLRRSREKVFQAPPIEWVQVRLTRLQEILERNADRSGPILRNLLGQLRLEPTRGDVGRPYYTARTSLNTLALLDPLTEDEVKGKRFEFFTMVEAAGIEPAPTDPPVSPESLENKGSSDGTS